MLCLLEGVDCGPANVNRNSDLATLDLAKPALMNVEDCGLKAFMEFVMKHAPDEENSVKAPSVVCIQCRALLVKRPQGRPKVV